MPRYHNNYVGLRNRFALLSEAYAYATFEDRIKATNYFMEESLNFANAERGQTQEDRRGRRSRIYRGQGARYAGRPSRSRARATILMGEVEDEVNPVNGACMIRRKDVLKAETMNSGLWFGSTATETVGGGVPAFPAEATKAIELLRAHGVQLRPVTQPVKDIERFAIASDAARQANIDSIDTGAHGLRTLTGAWEPAA